MKIKYTSKDLKIYTNYTEKIACFDTILPNKKEENFPFDILISTPTEEKPYYILATEGLGATQMKAPEKYLSRAELIMYLPKDWKLDIENESFNWPFEWLKIISKISKEDDTWLGKYHSIGSEKKISGFKGFLILPYLNIETGEIEEKQMKLSNNEVVNFLTVIPAYEEELIYKSKFGGFRFFKELRERVPIQDFMICTPNRQKAFEYDKLDTSVFEQHIQTSIELENPEKIIKFEDKGFEEMVRQLYNLEGIIQYKDIGYRTSLVTCDSLKMYGDYIDIYNVKLSHKVKSLTDLKWFPNLIELGLHGDPGDPIFFGNLSDLTQLKRLVILNVGGAIIKGELSELKELKHLKEIIVTGQGIKGNLSDVNHFSDLKELYVCDTRATGDLTDIKQLSKLERLTLSISKFTGDLTDLSKLTNLKDLDVSSSEIKGDIKHLQNLTTLKELRFDDSEIEGNLTSIENLTKLEAIYAGESEINGNINSLKKLKELRTINIYNTEIEGEIDFLLDFKCLHKLEILDTDINMNKDTLIALSKNTWIDVLEYENEENEENKDEQKDLYVQILHRKTTLGFEFFMLFQLDNEQAKICYGKVGENSTVEYIDWNVDKISELLKQKLTQGFEDYENKLEDLEIYLSDYPHINPESLVDTIQDELTGKGIGFVEEYKFDKVLQINCKVVDIEISKTVLKSEFDGYGVNFKKHN